MTRAALAALIVLAALWTDSTPGATPDGLALFTRCAACHLPDGKGVPGAFPPLGSQVARFAQSDSGRAYLVLVVATGVTGKLQIDDRMYQGWMPAQAGLSDAEIAAALNHVVRNVAKGSSDVEDLESSEVAAIRARHPQIDAAGVHRLRPEVAPSTSEVHEDRSAAAFPGVGSAQRARQHWLLNCQGCHGASAAASSSTPSLEGAVAQFLSSEGGRNYLARVPGVATAPLNDEELAELLNWMLYTYDALHVPSDFHPYSAAEVQVLRRNPLRMDAGKVRSALLSQRSGRLLQSPR